MNEEFERKQATEWLVRSAQAVAERPESRVNQTVLKSALDCYRDVFAVSVSPAHTSPIPIGLRELGRNVQGYQEYENIIDGTVLVLIPGSTFQMGSPIGVGDDDEHPQHEVTLSPYMIAKHEVTWSQYGKFCAATNRNLPQRPRWNPYDTHPVVNVSWTDAKAYCAWAGLALLTEAQWELAARGGKQFEYGTADGKISHELANYYGDGTRYPNTSPVGSYPANPYGIFDLSGNVWEWCEDGYWPYKVGPATDPIGAVNTERRVLRGGSWYFNPVRLRSAIRSWSVPDHQDYYVGFRVARAPF